MTDGFGAVPGILPFIDIGAWEWVIIGVVAVILFGNRLPDLGRTLGKGLVSFRKGVNEMKDEISRAANAPVDPAADKKAADDSVYKAARDDADACGGADHAGGAAGSGEAPDQNAKG